MITATIDSSSAVPPFEQLRSQLSAAINAGMLPTGTRLPSIRQIAGDLSLAPNTVARAYRALEDAGLVEGRGRRGTVVTGGPDPAPAADLVGAAKTYLAEATRLGLSREDAQIVLRLVG